MKPLRCLLFGCRCRIVEEKALDGALEVVSECVVCGDVRTARVDADAASAGVADDAGRPSDEPGEGIDRPGTRAADGSG